MCAFFSYKNEVFLLCFDVRKFHATNTKRYVVINLDFMNIYWIYGIVLYDIGLFATSSTKCLLPFVSSQNY